MGSVEFKINPAFYSFWTMHRRFKLAHGGRSSGKSVDIAQLLIHRSRTESCRILCCREYQNSIKESTYAAIEKEIKALSLEQEFDFTKTEIRHKYTGSVFLFSGLQTHLVGNIKSVSDVKYVFIEEAQYVSEKSLRVLIPTIRMPGSEIIAAFNRELLDDAIYQRFEQYFPEGSLVKKRFLINDNDPLVTQRDITWEEGICDRAIGIYINYDGNPWLTEESRLDMEDMKKTNYGQYLSDWLGQPATNSANALWSREWIDNNRWPVGRELPKFSRLVVAVDPAVSANEDSDATGIVVCAKGKVDNEDHYFVLEDLTQISTPSAWGRAVCSAYHKHLADKVIAETNNGGMLVGENIRNIDRVVFQNFATVHATRGKALRAQPIATLYEEGKVHHVGSYPDLENEQCFWNPDDTKAKSPNRLDALVYGVSYMAGINTTNGVTTFVAGVGPVKSGGTRKKNPMNFY